MFITLHMLLCCASAKHASSTVCCLPSHCLQDGTEKSRQIFITVPTEVGQTEAEEIGEWQQQQRSSAGKRAA
jgi:hypothetical protein